MRKLYDGKSMLVPNVLLNVDPNCVRPVELTHARTSAPTMTPQTLPMPPSTTIASRMIEMAKWKLSARHRCVTGRERRAADAADDGADRVGRQLGPHQRHAHHARRQLVLADRQPGAAEPALADPQRDEDREGGRAGRRRGTCTSLSKGPSVAGTPRRWNGPVGIGSTGSMPLVPLDRLNPLMSLAVAEHLRDDLAEAEGDQREVVALQPQRRRADDDAPQRAERGRRWVARARS